MDDHDFEKYLRQFQPRSPRSLEFRRKRALWPAYLSMVIIILFAVTVGFWRKKTSIQPGVASMEPANPQSPDAETHYNSWKNAPLNPDQLYLILDEEARPVLPNLNEPNG